MPASHMTTEHARELLAAEYEREGWHDCAAMLRHGKALDRPGLLAPLRAIGKALSLPRMDEVERLRVKLRMIISHASGGALSGPTDIDRSVNDICVEISRHKNEVWKHAQECALRDAALQPSAGWDEVGPELVEALEADPDLGKISEGHVCKHGVRWPHACHDCDRASSALAKARALNPAGPAA